MSVSKIIKIKRGRSENLPVLDDGELGYCKDTKELYIGNDGENCIIGGNSSSESVQADYIILQSVPSKKPFKITVSDSGVLTVQEIIEEEAPPEVPETPDTGYAGLIINQYYGGGAAVDTGSVSHCFVELYNSTSETIDLTGMSVQYVSYMNDTWEKVDLVGSVPAKCSYLIKCNVANDAATVIPGLDITDYPADLEWPINMINKGTTIALMATTDLIEAGKNPVEMNSYVDVIGASDDKQTTPAPFFETAAILDQSKQKSVRRVGFTDSNDNSVDCEIVDYRVADNATYKFPRYTSFGPWLTDDVIEPGSGSATISYEGLIINQYYGGGASIDETSVSHCFIELYNKSNKTLPLAGLSIQYISYCTAWTRFNLEGSIPPKHSFLIRAGLANDGSISLPSLDISGYSADMEWEMNILNKGTTIALMATTNLLREGQDPTLMEECIDLIGANDDKGKTLAPFYEGLPLWDQSKQKSVRRICFSDTNDNELDCEIVDFRYPASSYNKVPRTLSYGAWDEEDEMEAPDSVAIPLTAVASTITNTFGEDAKTSRKFTWNSTAPEGEVRIAEVIIPEEEEGEVEELSLSEEDIVVQSSALMLGEFNVHRAVVDGLKPGTTYVYQINDGTGENASDTFTFTTEAEDQETVTFIHVSDTQAVNQSGYDLAANAIDAAVNGTLLSPSATPVDFILHTGDIVQDGQDEIQWRQFFKANEVLYASNSIVALAGNNDATSESQLIFTNFGHHFTATGKDVQGVANYSFDYADIHFTVIQYGNLDVEWVDADLAATDKKWKIVAIHNAPYTTIEEETMVFHEIFKAHGVDLILCGHKHSYMRSNTSVTDVQYVMTGATGVKVTANSAEKQSWMETFHKIYDPAYNTITITGDTLTLVANQAIGSGDKTEISGIETFTITK